MQGPFLYGRQGLADPQETAYASPSSHGEDFKRRAYSGRFNYTNVRTQVPVGKFPGRPRPQEIQIQKSHRERRPFGGYVLALKGRGIHELEDPLT
jgi:hypothetical protein